MSIGCRTVYFTSPFGQVRSRSLRPHAWRVQVGLGSYAPWHRSARASLEKVHSRVSSSIFVGMDLKRNQLETRVATLELMLVTERARPTPNEHEIEKLEKELAATKSALQKYNEENP